MKAKLIKTIDGYHLRSLIKDIPRSINVYHKISETEGEFGFGEHSGKISKQNCDEIFGVVDVEKLAREWHNQQNFNGLSDNIISIGYLNMFKDGFNKAMELNKDKVFTLEQMSVAYNTNRSGTLFEQLINSFGGQPTEIEVEIVTTTRMENGKSGIDTPTIKPKLDSEGCLILKKI